MKGPSVHFFIGKGGVGKTALSLRFAQSLARQGKKILFVEISDQSHASMLLQTAELHYSPSRLEKGLWGIRVTGMEALKEYLVRQLKFERLYRLLFENRPVRYFFEAAPALRDLMILGKIVFELDQKKFDRIIIDSPSTGHALFLLRTPHVVRRLANFGPLFDRAKHIVTTLENERTTQIHVVTLARPVVIGETLELIQVLRKEKLPLGQLFINRVLASPDEISPAALRSLMAKENSPSVRILAKRSLSELREMTRLKKLSKLPTVLVRENIDGPLPEKLDA